MQGGIYTKAQNREEKNCCVHNLENNVNFIPHVPQNVEFIKVICPLVLFHCILFTQAHFLCVNIHVFSVHDLLISLW